MTSWLVVEQELAPVLCPISASLLSAAGQDVQLAFLRINEARQTGSLKLLERAQESLESWSRSDNDNGDCPIRKWDARNAALGDCLSIKGRWAGNEGFIQEGVSLINEFIGAIQTQEGKANLPDRGATQFRAQLCLGNALTREAYITHDSETLKRAVALLMSRPEGLPEDRFLALDAAKFRDLGDAFVGELFWAQEEGIDGAAIAAATKGCSKFAGKWAGTNDIVYHDEWAAAASSLAVAYAKTAWNLIRTKPTVSAEFLDGKENEEKGWELAEVGQNVIRRVWCAYVRRLTSEDNKEKRPGFRWARSVANLSYAASLLARLDRSQLRLAVLAEVGFLSVLREPGKRCMDRVIEGDFFELAADTVLEDGACYNKADHPGRYKVICKDLEELYTS